MAILNPNLLIKLILDSAGVVKGAGVALKNLSNLQQGSNSAAKRVDGLKKSLQSMWRITGGILLFNVIRHITHAVRDLIGTVLDFEKQMYNVNSVAQLSAEDFKKLTDQVIDLALDPRIKDGPAQLAAGLYEITSAGYSAKDALVVLEQAAIAATAGMTTSDVAAKVLTSTLGAYNLGVDQAAYVTNQLFQIVNISRYTFEDLASSLASVTPVASKLGIGMDEVGAAMATMAKQGVEAETATVQLNSVLSGLLKPTEAMQAAIEAAGYSSGEAMIADIGFGKTLLWLNDIVGGSAEKAAELFGDVRALRGIIQLTTADGQTYIEMLTQMGYAQDGAGATAKALEQQMKSNSFQIDIFRKNLEILAVLGFGLLAPHLNKVLVGINTFVSGAVKSFRHFREKGYSQFEAFRAGIKTVLLEMFGPEITKRVLKIIDAIGVGFETVKAVFLAVEPVVRKVLGFIFKHFDIIGPAILGAVIGMKLFSAALAVVAIFGTLASLSISPLTIALLAAAAIGALFAVAWTKNWFGIREKTASAIGFIGKWIGKLWNFIQPAIEVIKLLGEYFSDVMTHKIEPGNLAKLPGWLQPIAFVLGRIIKTVRVFIKTWQDKGFMAAINKIPAQIRAFGRAVAGLLDKMGLHRLADAVKKTFYDISHLFKHVVELVDDIVHGRWKEVWGDLKNIAVDLFKLFIDRFMMIGALLLDVFDLIPWGKIGSALWSGVKAVFQFLIDYGIPLTARIGWDLLKGMGDAIVEFWDTTLAPWLGGLLAKFAEPFVDAKTWLVDKGNDLIGGMWDGIQFAIDWGFGWFRKLPDWIKGIFSGAKDWLFWVGHDIMNGLWQGMIDVVNWMARNFKGLFDWMPDSVKKQLGIASPSKVFAAIGKEIPAGMAVGIKGGMRELRTAIDGMSVATGGPQLATGASRFSTGGPRLEAVSSAVRGNAGPQSISVTVNGANKTNEQVGEVVVREILRAARRRQTGMK